MDHTSDGCGGSAGWQGVVRDAGRSHEALGKCRAEREQHVAHDGKAPRGALSHEAADQGTRYQLALKERVVGVKENELSIDAQFLSPLRVKGRILSVDARLSQRSFCSQVNQSGGFFLLVAKDNQPRLRDDPQLF